MFPVEIIAKGTLFPNKITLNDTFYNSTYNLRK